MGSALVIWSSQPMTTKKVILSVMEAAYDSEIPFSIECFVRKRWLDDKPVYSSQYFALDSRQTDYEKAMLFHFSEYEVMLLEKDGEWNDLVFYDKNGNSFKKENLCRLAVTEDIDMKMSFLFAYHYLKIQPTHFLNIDSIFVDWEAMQELFAAGYNDQWCCLPS